LLLLYLFRGKKPQRDGAEPARSPLGLWTAIRMALVIQAVLLLVAVVRHVWGARGVLTSAALLGIADVDALTYSMTRLGGADTVALGAKAIAIGVLSNTILKLGFVVFLGRGEFRKIAGLGLAALAAASAVGLWVASQLPL
jgi:uncharacterized membrane protein (DUF4010 family)